MALSNAKKGATFFVEHERFTVLVEEVCKGASDTRLAELLNEAKTIVRMQVDHIKHAIKLEQLARYQVHASLLDRHLEGLVSRLMGTVRATVRTRYAQLVEKNPGSAGISSFPYETYFNPAFDAQLKVSILATLPFDSHMRSSCICLRARAAIRHW